MKFVCEFVGGKLRGKMPLEDVEKMTDKRSMDWSADRAMGALVPRVELDNRPVVDGYLGPMWDGVRKDGTVVLRYETPEVYDMLSR